MERAIMGDYVTFPLGRGRLHGQWALRGRTVVPAAGREFLVSRGRDAASDAASMPRCRWVVIGSTLCRWPGWS